MFYDFITKYTDIFVDKMREAFAKASHIFFNKKYWQISDVNILNFNDTLTNDVVSFEQPVPAHRKIIRINGHF